jgi:hypothetical protein
MHHGSRHTLRSARLSVTAVCSALAAYGVLFLLTASWPGVSYAQEPERQPRLLGLNFAAPDGCPDAEWFKARTTARTPLAVFPAPGQQLELEARIEVEPGGQRGSVELKPLDGVGETRQVSASSCSEVIDGMALIVAMAVDPSVTGSKEPSGGILETGAGSSPPDATNRTVPSASTQPPTRAVRTNRTGISRQLAGPPARRSPVVAPPLSWDWQAGLGPALADGAGPGLAPGALAWLLGGTVLGPPWELAAMASLEVDSRGTVALESDGSARFIRLLGRFAVCPVRWVPAQGLGVRPCAVFEAGVLRGEGVNVRERQTDSARWLAPGAMVRAEAEIAQRWVLALDGTISRPLANDRFLFTPDVEVFTIPSLSYALALSVGRRLP